MDIEETIEHVLEKRKSIIRWGDGETDLFEGYNIVYQEFSENLRKEMLEFIVDYEEESAYIIGLPVKFLKMSGWESIKNKRARLWMRTRELFKRYFNHNSIYIDAFIFGIGLEDKYKKLWNLKENCIFVHNNIKHAENFEKKYGIKTYFVEVKPSNSYSLIDKYEKQIMNTLKKFNLNNDNTAILISAGPAAKVLVYRLSKVGIVSFDTGHCWDNPLNPELFTRF
ncbi:GT-D fold domain-containing glycosyltransferase [Paenibacillus sp. J5C_2022]|uniref:GT-D fold domain-containing glycosyltransferase n=1 Tax=Paenibacillus sp. J5C2022 TaxID=2977129 RepID=UPI0021D0869B|nr:GT-D fold domain-containing glycosyltransferase [Paenibacillus sp. J5C2022]MCU6708772.1 GT-D fold domain-containing glycosyltransferase [Paenibacillus sp. J5C2022]